MGEEKKKEKEVWQILNKLHNAITAMDDDISILQNGLTSVLHNSAPNAVCQEGKPRQESRCELSDKLMLNYEKIESIRNTIQDIMVHLEI